MKTDHTEEAPVVTKPDAKKPSKKWPIYTLWIAGAVGAIFLLVFLGIFSRIWEWIQHDPYYSWSLTKLSIGAALIYFFWPKARKIKKTAGGLATIATEFKPLSLGAFGVYAGIIICLWALLPVIISSIFPFLGKYGWYVLAGICFLVAPIFFMNSKKKIGWISLAVAIVILTVFEWPLISSLWSTSEGSSDMVTTTTDTAAVTPPSEEIPVEPTEATQETTVQQPVPEKETPVETVEQPIVDTAAIAASDPSVQRKRDLRDSLQKAKVLSDVNKALDAEIAQLERDLVKPKKAKDRKNRSSSESSTANTEFKNKKADSRFGPPVASGTY